MNRGLVAFLSFLVLTLSAGDAASSELRTGVFKPPRLAPDFSLLGSNGAELKLSHYRGKVIALEFGYTSCPAACPITLAKLAQVQKKLGAASKKFQVVYVTVDPQRDSVAHLQKYLAAFDSTFIGATGTTKQLADVQKSYGIFAKKQTVKGNQSEYFFQHSTSVYLIDREGYLRAMAPLEGPFDDLVHDVESLLNQ